MKKEEKTTKKAENGDEKKQAESAEQEGVVFEYEEESSAFGKLAKLKEKLKKCEKEKREYLEGWQRAKADAVNEKKRMAELLEKSKLDGVAAVMEKILPALDNFEMAMKSKSWNSVDEIWRKGVEQIQKQLKDALCELGLQDFAEAGEKLDTSLHEAVKSESSSDKSKDGTISSVLRKGYKLNGKLLRPAQVSVYVFKDEGDSSE